MSDPVINLYGASVEVYFKPAGGPSISLSNILYGESVAGTANAPIAFDPQSVHFIERVSVSTSLLHFTMIEVDFNPTFEMAIKLIRSGVIGMGFSGSVPDVKGGESFSELASAVTASVGFNQISVRINYSNESTPFYRGVLMVPELDIGESGISIKLKATGILFGQSKKEVDRITKKAKGIDRLRGLLSKDVDIIIDEGDVRTQDALKDENMFTVPKSKLECLREWMSRWNLKLYEYGSEGFDGDHTYKLVSTDYMNKIDDDIYEFILWGQIDPNNNQYPILNMRTSIVNYLTGQAAKRAKNYDTSLKKISETDLDGKNITSNFKDQTAAPGATTGGTPKSPKSEEVEHAPRATVPNRGNDFGKQMSDTFSGLFQKMTEKALHYEVTTVCVPELRPGRSVIMNVAGVEFLSGTYDLYEVKHEVGLDGAHTHLTLACTFGLAALAESGIQAGFKPGPTPTTGGQVSSEKEV